MTRHHGTGPHDANPSDGELRAAPKVVLHDHLDGGIRPETLAELAELHAYDGFAACGPEAVAAELDRRSAGTLEAYLEAFAHPSALLRTPDDLHRVAFEAVVDLAGDGVVYAEVRFAPALHTVAGLDLDQVIDAVTAGVVAGTADVRSPITVRLIVTALRHHDGSAEVAEAAARHSERRSGIVVGFDLAGVEAGHPARRHRTAIAIARRDGLGITIHAGEGTDLASIADALDAGADRIGHGCALIDDITVDDAQRRVTLGPVAEAARRAHIEACPSSNVHTGAVATLAAHPAQMLAALGYSVSINTDNRTMSCTDVTSELGAARDEFHWDPRQLESAQLAALGAAFCDPDLAGEIAEDLVMAGWEPLYREPGRG